MAHTVSLVDKTDNIADVMMSIGHKAREASTHIRLASTEQKNKALRAMAQNLRALETDILAANAEDVAEAQSKHMSAALIDRLTLTPARLEAIAQAVDDIALLSDPVGRTLATWQRPNGLVFERVATPLGVIGVIFESRPNVVADAGALCLKAGNAAILRAGSDSFKSAIALSQAMQQGLEAAGLPATCIQLVPIRDRQAVGEMLKGLDGNIDVIVPRGGKSLVERVQTEARVPVFAHLEGICHIYVHSHADFDMALSVVKNAKLRRTGVCGAVETLLIDQVVVATHLKPLLKMLLDAGCAVRGDDIAQQGDERVTAATEQDWRTEYLDAILAVKIVSGLDEAIEHINTYGSHHTDCILTDDDSIAVEFLNKVDSAIVIHNASTQFADGGEFGFGAEIGIATGKMHARGPVGLEQLTSFNYRVRGSGQTRP